MSRKLRKVCVCGHFGFGKNLLNGQTVKTKILSDELDRRFGSEEVLKLDTHGGIKALFKLPFKTFMAMKDCKNIIILPAHNGLRVITPMLVFERLIFKRSLHYTVIGGWLADFLKKKKILTRQLKKFDAIYVETSAMKKSLEDMGFTNILIMPNCKILQVIPEEELVYNRCEPYKLCTFSRVSREKGIEEAVKAVENVNSQLGKIAYKLDIYGPVSNEESEWFDNLQKTFPEYVKYGGVVQFDRSVEVLKDYFALLFPTKAYTEGFPGTIIDAYSSGVPVISSEWESFHDVIEDGVCGIGYGFSDIEALQKLLKNIVTDPEIVLKMKKNCLLKAREFSPDKVVDVLAMKLN